MDFAGKIRAARAYMEWTQEQLAEAAELSLAGIQKIERGENEPTARTQKKLIRAFEQNGLTLTSKGIEHDESPVFFIEGDDHESAYFQLLEDAYEHLKGRKGPELLIMYADDKVSPPSVNDFYRKMRKADIKMRQMIQEGNTYIIGPLSEYRYIPKKLFINRVTLVYGDRIATETTNFNKVLVRVDPINAAIQKNTFNILWNVLKQPEKTTAHETFE